MTHNKKVLTGLDHKQYEHPFDKKTLYALENTPGLRVVGNFFTKHTIERFYTVMCTGSNICPYCNKETNQEFITIQEMASFLGVSFLR